MPKTTRASNRTLAPLEPRRRNSIPRLLWFAFHFIGDLVYGELARRGHRRIRPGHSLVLRNMDLDGTPLTVLTQRAGVSRQAIAKVAAGLRRLGYLQLVPDPADRRGKIVQPTPRGRRLILDSFAAYEYAERRLARELGPAGLGALRGLLLRLVERIAEPGERGWAARPVSQKARRPGR